LTIRKELTQSVLSSWCLVLGEFFVLRAWCAATAQPPRHQAPRPRQEPRTKN